MTNQVFVSYSRKNEDYVNYLKEKLSDKFDLWIDRERLPAGTDWREEIDQNIRISFALIVLLSRDSCISPYVTYEWAYALGEHVPVIPIKVENAEMDLHPRMQNIQYFDFSANVPSRHPWDALIRSLEDKRAKYSSVGAAETAWKFIEQGRALAGKQNYLNAFHAFDEAAKFASPSLKDDIFYEVGTIHAKLGNVDKAEEYYKRALDVNANHVEALVELAVLYRKKSDKLEDAQSELQRESLLIQAQEKLLKALSLDANLRDNEGESVWGSLGGIYQRLNNYDKAVECYEKAISVYKTSYPFNNLGLLYMEKDEFDAMRDNFALVKLFAQQKIRINPADEWAHNDVFVALLIEGNLLEAKDSFRHIRLISSPYALGALDRTLRRLQLKKGALTSDVFDYVSEALLEIEKILTSRKR